MNTNMGDKSDKQLQMDLGSEQIPQPLYKEIYNTMPIFTVDAITVDGRDEYLLVRRTNKPWKGSWAFPRGRVLKNEKVQDAAVRKVKEETGLMGTFVRQVGFYELIDLDGYFEGTSAHTPVIVCLVNVEDATPLHIDAQSSEFKWCKRIEPDLHPHMKEMLVRAGFKE
jgi:colanic acid biosynthesis protein WcaH